MIWQTLIDPTICNSLLLTLVHSLWQMGLLALIVFLLDQSRRMSVERRYTIHVIAMVIGIILVPVTFATVNANVAIPANGPFQSARAGSYSGFSPAASLSTPR